VQFAKVSLDAHKGLSYEKMVKNLSRFVQVNVFIPSVGNGQPSARLLTESVERFGASLVRILEKLSEHKELHKALVENDIKKISVSVMRQIKGSKRVYKSASALVTVAARPVQEHRKKKRAA